MDTLPLIFTILTAVSGIWYLTLQCLLLIGLRKSERATSDTIESVSIIIAARNEQENLPHLLERLLKQTYPFKEIILINDRSTDGTLSLMEGFQARDGRIVIITIPRTEITTSPKKNALKAGIARSTGNILCFTDADCLPEPMWVEGMVRYFDDATGFVTGPCFFQHEEGSRSRFYLDYEEFKKAIFTAGSIGLEYAWLAKGGNMAFRREVFQEIGGYRDIEHSIGGDDDLLVQRVQRKTAWKVRYAFSTECRMTTKPTTTAAGFLRQRRRHVSAGKYYPAPLKAALFLFHASNLVIVGGMVFASVHPMIAWTALICLSMKCIVDLRQLYIIGVLLKVRFPLRSYPAAEFLFVLYHTFIAPIGLVGKIGWRRN